jgi:flagellar basal body-associated protein FliL
MALSKKEAKMTSAEKIIKDDEESIRTVNAKHNVRQQLDADIEAFLAKGGAISEIDANVTADPPIKPVSKYGGRPI